MAMLFWVLAAVLTAAVTVALLLPLARRREAGSRADHDVEVYSDQLAEVDRDRANGLIGEDEATYARAEIARRLLRANRKAGGNARSGHARAEGVRRIARVAVILGVPTAALGAYVATGSPDVPHQPLAQRLMPGNLANDDPTGVAALVSQAERHLAENPEDGRGWDVLAPIYLRSGRPEDAANAYRNAIRLLGPDAARQSGYGETLVALSGGVVTEEARLAFQSAREIEPGEVKSAFYLAMAMVQEGREDRALQAFRDIAGTSPPDAPWMPAVNAHIEALGGAAPAPVPPSVGALSDDGATAPQADGSGEAPRDPDADDLAAAGRMGAQDRAAMVEGMVESLDARLRENPDNIEGWVRLVRSYGVLGRTEDAGDALRRGLEVFPANSEDGRQLIAEARRAGIATGEGAPAEEDLQ
jgi:cytochrome c-type biogenesis protein CcmH